MVLHLGVNYDLQRHLLMTSPKLPSLMELYAKKGVRHWLGKETSQALRTRAEGRLGGPTQIANDEVTAVNTIGTFYDGTNASQLSLIPMPKCGKGIERCFFLPVRRKTPVGTEEMSFELLLLVQGKKCLAFRFEPAHSVQGRHGYGHVQMSRKMLKGNIALNEVLGWLPDSYPAFPISTSNPLKLFFAMITAVHGYESPGGLRELLIETFQEANRMPELPAYLAELRETLIRESTSQDSVWIVIKSLFGRLRQYLS